VLQSVTVEREHRSLKRRELWRGGDDLVNGASPELRWKRFVVRGDVRVAPLPVIALYATLVAEFLSSKYRAVTAAVNAAQTSEESFVTIACFGEALAVLVQEQPGPLERAETFTRSIGGAETNVAIALAALGTPSAIVTRVGADGFGRYIGATLADLGVDVSAIDVDPARETGVYLKEVGGTSGLAGDLGPNTSRMHYYRAGSASSALSPAFLDIPAVAYTLSSADVVHTTGITPALSDSAAATQTALFERKQAGQLLSFDLNWRPALWRDKPDAAHGMLGAYVDAADIALLGSDEASAVFGVGDPAELRRMFPGPRWLVVKDDSHAAIAFDGSTRVEVSPSSVDVVEAIGAGDAFAAGLLSGLAASADLGEAMRTAHLTAARALSSVHDHVGHDQGGHDQVGITP
jgi:2-dehydro-3-deoxygluconokinase